jgi:chromosome segregation ATPase
MRTLFRGGPRNAVPPPAVASVFAGVFAAMFAACGPSVSLRVEQRSLKDLPLESRLDLLDAENDLFAAVDRRDDAEQGIDDARVALRRADKRVSEEDHDLDQARDRRDAAGIEVGKLAVQEAKAHRRVKEWDLDLAKGNLDVEEARLLVAQGRFERAKADVARKARTAGAADLKLKDFDRQVDDLQKHVKDVQNDVDKLSKRSEKDRQKWQALSRQLAELTGGAQGSAWVQ